MLSTAVSFLAQTVRLSCPILLASLGGVYASRSGVLNISLEGCVLTGSLAGVIGSYYTGSPFMGLFLGILCGALLGLVHGFFTLTCGGNHAVIGTGINIFCTGITAYTFRAIFASSTTTTVKVKGFSNAGIPVLRNIPVIGPIIFKQNIFVFIAIFMVIFTYIYLYKTMAGLNHVSCGENSHAADSLGIKVVKIRYIATIVSSVMAAIGGVALSIGNINTFVEDMSAGKGWIALAALSFGRWNPIGVALASILFGLADAFQLRMQIAMTDAPYQYFQMIPYIVTIIVLIWTGRKGNLGPKTGEFFEKEAK
ncbi:MAG: ABC transporter permease [Clostridiales bacterium]|nr:ABC transporter permease [Clostridiales bacterium]